MTALLLQEFSDSIVLDGLGEPRHLLPLPQERQSYVPSLDPAATGGVIHQWICADSLSLMFLSK